MENDIENYLLENRTCYDRFSFDKVFRFLLSNDYSHEEAKDLILLHCTLSAIIFQERIDNKFYQKIKVSDTISADLQQLKNAIFIEKYPKEFLN